MKPKPLTKSAESYFNMLYGLVKDDLKTGDENLLALLANTYTDYDEAAKCVEDKGLLLAGDTMYRANPMVKVKDECRKAIESLSLHFGLSPKARGEKFESKGNGKDELDDLK